MEGFERFRHIDSHFASKQILKGFERSNHKRVNIANFTTLHVKKLLTKLTTKCYIVRSLFFFNSGY